MRDLRRRGPCGDRFKPSRPDSIRNEEPFRQFAEGLIALTPDPPQPADRLQSASPQGRVISSRMP